MLCGVHRKTTQDGSLLDINISGQLKEGESEKGAQRGDLEVTVARMGCGIRRKRGLLEDNVQCYQILPRSHKTA